LSRARPDALSRRLLKKRIGLKEKRLLLGLLRLLCRQFCPRSGNLAASGLLCLRTLAVLIGFRASGFGCADFGFRRTFNIYRWRAERRDFRGEAVDG